MCAVCVLLASAALLGGCASTPRHDGAGRANPAAPTPSATASAGATQAPASEIPASTSPTPAAVEQSAAVAATQPPALEPKTLRAGLPTRLDSSAILRDTRRITQFGVRRGGSKAERRAADFVIAQLQAVGYQPEVKSFRLPGGQSSRNVIVVIEGTDPRRVVLSAHTDSRVPSPGANDNAVGCAVLLALARAAKGRQPTPTVELAFFGSEEYRDSTPGRHHFGSRARVASLSAKQIKRIAGMISLDVIAVGSHLHVRTMGRGPMAMADLLLRTARRRGVSMTYLRDPGSTGWSDHEAYENEGVPVAWIERLTDPAYHTTGDTSARLKARPVAEAVGVVLETVNSLDATTLDRLARRRAE